jgi:ParB/RepB/Spo0J family partition protein
MSTMKMMPTGHLKADPGNPRKQVDESELGHLGDDLVCRGVLVPLLARPDGTLIDGWRRWLAAQKKGIKELPVIVTDKPESEIPAIRLATVFHKVDLKPHEKAQACLDILASHPDWHLRDLAEFLHIDASSVTRWCSLSKVIPAWKEALAKGTVGISDVYAASKAAEEDQLSLLDLKLKGASRDAIEKAGRQKRNSNRSDVKASRVKIAMPEGVTVVISGPELEMTEIVELLTEALKEARKAAEQFDVKTWQAMMRDKSRAG